MTPRAALPSLVAFLLAGCVSAPAPNLAPGDRLAGWFDCLRTRGEAVIGAHRAGYAAGLPENALPTMAATLARNPDALLEIDIRVSSDGVLLLFHDDDLERTSNGTGKLAERTWAEIAGLRLRDNDGQQTDALIPRLSDALSLAKARGAVVQLDVKRGVDFAAVVAEVRRAGAEDNVTVITYNAADALTVARLAPELMQSARVRNIADAQALLAGGLRPDRLLAWTGTGTADPALFGALRQLGIEPLFGTIGRRGTSAEDRWLSDGDAGEFAALERDGVVVVATARGSAVETALGAPSCRR